MKSFSFSTCLLLLATISSGRPISYPDSWTAMQMHNWEKTRLHVHYSASAKNSFGLVGEDFHGETRQDIDLQWNHLLHRKNTRTSQANLYLKSQLGVAYSENDQELATDIKMAGDWETRRYFLAYETGFEYAGSFDNGSFHQMGRLGVAPYLAEYGGFHTWIMLQLEHHPGIVDDRNQLILTPLFRFFKGDYLTEVGLNTNGDLLFNFIIRF